MIKHALAVLLALAFFGWFVASGQWNAVGKALVSISPSALLPAVLGFAASYLLRALRVWDEFRHDGKGRFGACLRIVLIHNALVNIVPFRAGEAAFPILIRRIFGTPLHRALASLFWFRLQDAFVVLALAIMLWPGLPTVLRLLGVASIVAVALTLPFWARRRRGRHDGSRWRARFDLMRDAFAESASHARFSWLWTIANWAVKLAAQAWLLSFLTAAGFAVGAAGALGAELASILPVQGIAGFGTYEAGAAAAMLPFGIDLEVGLRAALLVHLFAIALACSAALLAWLSQAVLTARTNNQTPMGIGK